MKSLKINNSKNFYKKVIKIIPSASQTFSKSSKIFDKNFFPLFSSKGINQYLIDLDNNKFLDFVNGLGSVTLGYAFKKFNNEIISTLKNGITFSLSHKLEFELAQILKKNIPSAEMVKFGKNGTDANSAAIRLARYYTKKSHIGICGYHGWQDWYIASTNLNGGIPNVVKKFTHVIKFNDLDDLENKFKKNKFAAIIIEPISSQIPELNFLKRLRHLCSKNNTILIFDEICTGFRVSLGGAQKIFNITPDISTFGKAMGNGMPISAIVGKAKIMKFFDKIFYSGTFGGETLSLKSGIFTIKYLKKNKIIEKNIKKGKFLLKNLNMILKRYNLHRIINFTGHPSWLFLNIKNVSEDEKIFIRTFFMQEYALNKILFLGSFNINASHNKKDLQKLIRISDKILKKIYLNKDIKKLLIAKPLKPFFKVRN